VNALTEARLLVKSRGESNQPAVEVAHEAIFTNWPRLSRWIEEHAGELRVCRRLTRAAQEWEEAGAPHFKHLPDRATLKQYRKVLPACSLGEDDKVVGRFLGAAGTRQRVFEGTLAFIVAVFVGLGAFFWWATVHDYSPAIAVEGLLARVGVLSPIEPDMLPVQAGSFQMGSPQEEAGRYQSEGPVRTVTFQRSFLIGKHEVTFAEYDRFAAATGRPLPGDQGWGRGLRPVINVSWEDAKAYADWLNKKTGKEFRLPSEAEWEYACRTATRTRFYTGDSDKDLDRAGWYWDNSGGQTHPVGEKAPNAWGLYDMHGNVYEWVEDDWHGSYERAPSEGQAWVDNPRGSLRVVRGGSWIFVAQYCRSAVRDIFVPDGRSLNVGFRLSRSVALGS
jgi:formylglycine-generating enzyme required for sulfatase activity